MGLTPSFMVLCRLVALTPAWRGWGHVCGQTLPRGKLQCHCSGAQSWTPLSIEGCGAWCCWASSRASPGAAAAFGQAQQRSSCDQWPPAWLQGQTKPLLEVDTGHLKWEKPLGEVIGHDGRPERRMGHTLSSEEHLPGQGVGTWLGRWRIEHGVAQLPPGHGHTSRESLSMAS